MPMRDLADLERRIRRLEMGVDQSRHKLVVPERTVSVAPPLGAGDVPYVDLTTDQTVGGVKTFNDIPILPATNPTNDNEAVRKAYVDSRVVFLSAVLTSPNWNLNPRSSTPKTKIDLSAEFGVPAGIKAVMMELAARDSGSLTGSPNGGPWFVVSPNSIAWQGVGVNVAQEPNDAPRNFFLICPCDVNGDIYYQCDASGVGTLDIRIQILGYWL